MEQGKLTSDELKDIAAKGYADPCFFLKFFLAHKFPKDIPWIHRGILAILTRKTDFLKKYGELDKIIENFQVFIDPSDPGQGLEPIFTLDQEGNILFRVKKFSMLMLPRGYAKTTLAGLGVVLYWILYQDRKFPIYVSETQTHAEIQLGNVAWELENNPRILSVFGNIVPERSSRLRWTQDMLQTTTGITICARGRGGQIRGMNVNGQRPDTILLDDVEDRESVKTTEQRAKTKTWAYGDVIPALPEMDETATIMAIGTLLHPEALLMSWLADSDWTAIVFGVRDRQGEPLWLDNMNEEKIQKKKDMYARAGQLAQYYLEYENTIRADEAQKFRQSMIIYEPKTREDCVGVSIALDPAISNSKDACAAAIAVTGMDEKGLITVLDYWEKVGATPNEQLEEYFSMVAKWNTTLHGIESIAFQAALIHICREWMFRKKRYFEIIPLRHSSKKEERIEGILQPRYASGYMRHSRRFPELESQLLDWPNGKKDGPDVLSMAVALLDPHAPQASFADGGKDLGEDEYEPLDKVLKGDWRAA